MGTIASSGSATVTPKYSRFRRRLLIGLVVVLLVVGGAVWFLVAPRSGDDGTAVDPGVAEARLPDVEAAAPVLAALTSQAPPPDADVLAAGLEPLLTSPALGAGVSASVVDVATGEALLDRDADAPVVPASTAKLLTAVAALTTLDPETTFETTVVAGEAPGEVVLVGGGDPTLSTTVPSLSYPGAPTVADLAAQVRASLPEGTQVTRVVVDSSLFTGPLTASGWGPDDAPSTYAAPVTAIAVDGARVRPGEAPRSGQPGLDAGAALADDLGVPGATIVLDEAPEAGETLGAVRSAPVARLVEQTLSQSDNLLAETLARHVALARDLPATFEGSAEAVPAALTDAGLDVTGVALSDGSGLSQEDRVPVELLTDLLAGAADGTVPEASAVLSGLAVAGYDGTLADRGDDDPRTAPGAVRAKTGTLLGVHGLAGTVVTADGRLLAFAVVADGAPADGPAAEEALDVVASALAACGCR
ncbi:D-alanyl-D-alanine carboxypeptidase/D-alanyl-D-alanine endopeptidase [Geodermatophilus sabuli]|uniref:D-alanyl-D-alanine carboxypeptidase / D-alanyl-D-alanine-endopeptidase (Penicillin-binding protein 4) n=1 Tax=Geodermatophilus sabuli TaxID=1564158 RepID=A0A285ECV4_9ACTN|nr:D-alanyl-D-alanine carboxypeptidase/D-alanyl-D-alanine-endopeptidase [Geodermatophilus sabuli]MBB3083424.1 D-alanyl-D-alanine carboxypeptidase/D-alanyl-D-alanine-endopeptidase (penicillin-binding protein 4) [Geodermatophilus sabuli]SNX96855.1 D-alanyl-D-alanine carboxypeptidase / D-alanyl-D-alanine-endopeptidase (penicillin-binding protein 4) [Geodermatophilus sabuli]